SALDRLAAGGHHVQHLHMGAAHADAAGELVVVVDGGENRATGRIDVLGRGGGRIDVGQVAGHGVQAHGLGVHGRAGDAVDGFKRHAQRPSMACLRPLNFMVRKVRLVWKSMELRENSACSTPSSTVLPSREAWWGTRYFSGESMASALTASPDASRLMALAKSMSRAWKPGVSTLARLAARISLRCMRTCSAWACTPITSSIRILIGQ